MHTANSGEAQQNNHRVEKRKSGEATASKRFGEDNVIINPVVASHSGEEEEFAVRFLVWS